MPEKIDLKRQAENANGFPGDRLEEIKARAASGPFRAKASGRKRVFTRFSRPANEAEAGEVTSAIVGRYICSLN